jgi:hypothetical protein
MPLPNDVQFMAPPLSVNPADTPDPFGPSNRPGEAIVTPATPRGPEAQPTGHTRQRAQKLGIIIPGLLATMGSSDFSTPSTRKVLRQYEASIVPLTDA